MNTNNHPTPIGLDVGFGDVKAVRLENGAYKTVSFPAILGLAKADGFGSVGRLLAFFRQQYGLPFEGRLIKW